MPTGKAKLTHPQAMSFPARLMANGLNMNALRTNDLLRKDEWEKLDQAVVEVARQRLNGIADLMNAGLTHDLGSLGVILSQYEQMSDMDDAERSMSGVKRGTEDSVEFTLKSVPVPITHKDFRINIRRLQASRLLGETVDVSQARTASRLVRDSLEDMLFNGASALQVDGNGISGYTTHSDRGTHSGSDWGTIANIYSDVISMISVAEAANYYGPFVLYVAGTQYGEMREVYTDGSGQKALDRVLALPEISAVKPADVLTDEAVLVQLDSDVVDLAVAEDIMTVQWDHQGGMETNFKVMAAMVPRIKSDANGNSGVVHATGI